VGDADLSSSSDGGYAVVSRPTDDASDSNSGVGPNLKVGPGSEPVSSGSDGPSGPNPLVAAGSAPSSDDDWVTGNPMVAAATSDPSSDDEYVVRPNPVVAVPSGSESSDAGVVSRPDIVRSDEDSDEVLARCRGPSFLCPLEMGWISAFRSTPILSPLPATF
jgi:hypothetical protein